ncbi:MAG: transcription-repair coupling factor [Prevotella sp.]|nr:transcription-repair coupling factor [Prevotella sp.]
MKINELIQLYGQSPAGKALAKTLDDQQIRRIHAEGLMASASSVMLSSVMDRQSVVLFILQDADEAGYFYHDIEQTKCHEVLFFPSSYRRAVKYGQRDAANEILRTEVLTRLTAKGARKPLFVVTHPEAMAELVVSKRQLDEKVISLHKGDTMDMNQLRKQLLLLGFHEQDYVYEPGQFAIRGSILDVYSFSGELPFRIDFFDDEIDTIRSFEVQDQLSKEQKDRVDIVPELTDMAEQRIPLFDFLPDNALLVMRDYTYVRDTIAHIYEEGFSNQALAERMEQATELEQRQIAQEMKRENALLSGTQFIETVQRFRWLTFGGQPKEKPQATHSFHISPQPLFHKNLTLLTQTLNEHLAQGYRLFILADSAKQIQRLRDIFNQSTEENDPATSLLPFEPVDHTLHEGFIDHDLKACFFTDHQIFDRFHKYNLKSDAARVGKMALTMKEIQEMEPGDFIVHVDFGIGKFAGLVRVPSGDSYQEMIRILYQRGDMVDVSIHSLYKISKYRRSETGEPPRLSTLGTGAWERMKERTKKRIKDIARDLIKLYARRRHEKGFAFSADNYMQHELEASFLYEDTPDQLRATNEVKNDMEQARPMDRLVCGDVGFGKTEVAVRAAFKAACDSKQVAVLVPTTVLAFQHFQTFSERLRDLPVRVEYLSRARSTKKTKDILADLAEGKIDILIGTHKLIGKTVKWKDIGLLIIDEEQKFGVATKEKIRQMKSNIDTLTMSATPIPRTLQFSLMGARDMSIIRTPPPNRYPIHTELASFNHEVIADAIGFEMSRNGQVFFVNDRISNLEEIARLIHKYVPDARVAIGHGRMKPEELENIIMGFINYDYDVLLSTTIVENGVDIPNANTIIINDAHRFGLSDLHQMRGRVGRSNRKAFCYLLAPPKSLLPPEARRRLEALETFSELGSGFNLAMQDLDIRGAGNLLGAEQSGFMEDLGYETYQKILSQAVTELKNEEFSDLYAEEIKAGQKITGEGFVDDCALESDMDMFFPDLYVPGSSERMLLYRELDNIISDDDLAAYRKRLEDRFGPVPREGEELMQVVPLRRIGRRLGCEKIILKNQRMQMQFVSRSDSPFYFSEQFGKVIKYVTDNPRRCKMKEVNGRRSVVINDISTVGEAVFTLRQIDKGNEK